MPNSEEEQEKLALHLCTSIKAIQNAIQIALENALPAWRKLGSKIEMYDFFTIFMQGTRDLYVNDNKLVDLKTAIKIKSVLRMAVEDKILREATLQRSQGRQELSIIFDADTTLSFFDQKWMYWMQDIDDIYKYVDDEDITLWREIYQTSKNLVQSQDGDRAAANVNENVHFGRATKKRKLDQVSVEVQTEY